MEGIAHSEKSPQVYDREEVARTAVHEVTQEVENRLRKIGEASVENTTAVLRMVLAEYAAVQPGTTIPLDNGNRHRAEAAAKMLSQVEAEKVFAEVMTRTRLPANDGLVHAVAA